MSASGVRLANRHRFARVAVEVQQRRRDIATGTCHGPTWDRAPHRRDRAIADRHEDVLSATAGNCRRGTRRLPASRREVEPARRRVDGRRRGVILGGFARRTSEIHVDRPVAEVADRRRRARRRSRFADNRYGRAALAERTKRGRSAGAIAARRSAPVAPGSRVAPCPALRRARTKVETPARHRRARARESVWTGRRHDVVDDRIGCRRPAASNDRSPPALAAGSPRCRAAPNRNRGRPFGAGAIEHARAAAIPISMPGPPIWTAGCRPQRRLVRVSARMLPTPRIMIGL